MQYVIYKITCNNSDIECVYVGSSINFVKRAREHKNRSKHETNMNKLYTTIREHGGFDNWTVEAVETGTFETVLETRIRERFFFEELRADLNTYRPVTSREEKSFEKVESTKRWRNANKEKFKENERQYYKNNEEKIKQYQLQYNFANKDKRNEYRSSHKTHCEACNWEIRTCDKARHNKTHKHLKNLELNKHASKN